MWLVGSRAGRSISERRIQFVAVENRRTWTPKITHRRRRRLPQLSQRPAVTSLRFRRDDASPWTHNKQSIMSPVQSWTVRFQWSIRHNLSCITCAIPCILWRSPAAGVRSVLVWFSHCSTDMGTPMAFGTLAIRWHPWQIFRRSSRENPSVGGVKRKRGSQIKRFLTHRRLYLGNGAR